MSPEPSSPSSAEPSNAGKIEIYRQTAREIESVLEGEDDRVARMASVACLLHHAFPGRFIWTGFYVVDPVRERELVVGPYQGKLGCLRIAFGKGVCGTAAATRETQIVDDVHAFPGHITCDAEAESEIVLPVNDPEGALIAVLDVDSATPGAFDQDDARALRGVLDTVFAQT